MKTEFLNKDNMILVGISIRTSNAAEADPATAKIAKIWENFFANQIFSKVKNQINEQEVMAVYTNYENDYKADYTMFVGHVVSGIQEDFEELGLELIEIPAQKYVQFTTESGAMPNVCVNAWQEIWKMENEPNSPLYQQRNYKADLEVYSMNMDPKQAIVNILIGIKE
jgi:predicted transcriptional regulator YdeE